MNLTNMKKSVTLGGRINLNDFVAVSRFHAELLFSEDYCRRVSENRKVVEQWIAENKVMYGVTTGFGSLCNKVISPEEAGAAPAQYHRLTFHLGRGALYGGAGAGSDADGAAEPWAGI